jgi:Ca2+/H+ antiporter
VVQGLIVLSLASIAALPLCLFLAPLLNLVAAALGLWFPTRELRRILRGEGPLRGARQARLARVLGALNLVLVVLWVSVYLYVFYSSTWSRGEGT